MRRGSPGHVRGRDRRLVALVFLLGFLLPTVLADPLLAADTIRPRVTSLYVSPSSFSPNGDGRIDTAGIRFRISEKCRVTIRIASAATGATLRTLRAGAVMPAGYAGVVWDGKDGSGKLVRDGRYVVRLYVRDVAGNPGIRYPYSVSVWVDTTKPSFQKLWATVSPFSPNADGRKDTTQVRFSVSEKGYAGARIAGNGRWRAWRSLPVKAGTSQITWNGRDQSNKVVPDGSYTVTVTYRDAAGNPADVPTRTWKVVVDTIPPRVTDVGVSPNVMTPYDRDGQDDVASIRYTLDETSTWSYTIRNPFSTRIGGGSISAMSPGPHSTAWTGKQKVGDAYVVVPHGHYPIRMVFGDAAGNRRSVSGKFVVHSYYLICVDPGHGGKNGVYDPGAVGPTGLRESVVNFDIGYNRLRPILEAVETSTLGYPIKVLMTRTQERVPYMTLSGRSSLANSRGANIFVSIHCNAAIISSARGTETYYYNDGTSRGDKSKMLASYIQNRVIRRTGRYSRGVKDAAFHVLRYTRMPSVLHETAFISNPSEEGLLKTGTFRAQVAAGMRDGIVAYLKVYP